MSWDRVGLVVLPEPGRTLPARVREHTSAPILVYAPRRHDDIDELPDRAVMVGSQIALRSLLRSFMDEMFDQEVAILDDDETGDPAALEAVMEAYHEADNPIHVAAVEHNAHLRVEDVMASLDRLIAFPPVNHLKDRFRAAPAIIVGAGPSLDGQIEAVKRWRDRCLVLAVNTSWPALERAGVTPDAVVVCEAKPVERSLTGMPFDRTIMIPGMHVGRGTWDLGWRRIAPAVSHEGAFGQWVTSLFGLDPAPIGGSSACLAAGVAWLLGCDPIVLVGCDCAPQAGAMYSSGAAFAGTTVAFDGDGAATMTKSAAKLGVEDLGPRREVTHEEAVVVWNYDHTARIPSLVLYDNLRQWFEEIGEMWGGAAGRELVNASVGGAHILGWRHVGVDEALSDEQALRPCDFGAEMVEALDAHAAVATATVTAALERQAADARAVQAEAQKGVAAIQRLARVVEALGPDSPLGTTWHELERSAHELEHQPIFERLAADTAAKRSERPELAAGLDEMIAALGDARRAQLAVSDSGVAADLVEAYSCGVLEAARRKGDRPVLDVFDEMFCELEAHCAQLVPLLETVKERIANG